MFDFFKKKEENKSALGEIVANTSKALVKNILDFAFKAKELDEFTLEDIEAMLIKADLGVDLSVELVEKLKKEKISPDKLENFLKKEFEDILSGAGDTKLNYIENDLNIYMVVGINGAGKTTLIGKFANKLREEGRKVLIAAGDTFRAAAEEQLDIWAKRANVDIYRKDRAESAAVVWEAIEKALNEHYDTILVDTAGRLQNKFNLIEELKKVKSVIDKKAPEKLRETILVLDANLGQNGLSQAEVFKEAVDITSVAMTKLDGSAKGGLILSVAQKYKLPAKLIGVGEKIEDIKEFSPQDFIEALF